MNRWRWEAVEEMLSNPLLGAEIGVKEGRFITHMLSKFPSLTMYAIDPWIDQPKGNETYEEWSWADIYSAYRAKTEPYWDRVKELRGFSRDGCHAVEDGSLDFAFLDAQHDYDSVKEDIELWAPKIKPGGLLCGHDYQPRFEGVIQAVDEAFTNVTLGDNDVWAMRL